MREHGVAAALALCASFAAACGNAGPAGSGPGPAAGPEARDGASDARSSPAPDAGQDALATGTDARCVASSEGSLRARIDGDLRADIDWAPPLPQCRGGPRPGGDGVRLIYRGEVPGQGPLLVVIGIGPLAPGQDLNQVPANVTLVREGTGRFYATQGNDKCAADEVRQTPVGDGSYRITVRGYCVQPARTLDGTASVLMSRFDATAVVAWQ